jgi:deoxyhypusine synthase
MEETRTGVGGPGGPGARRETIDLQFDSDDPRAVREGTRLLEAYVFAAGTTVGLTVSASAPPADGLSELAAWVERGYVDWIVASGSLLIDDVRAGWRAGGRTGDGATRDRLRLFDLLFTRHDLETADAFLDKLVLSGPLQKVLSTAQLHAVLGRFLAELALSEGAPSGRSLLAAAQTSGVPVFSAAPGDSPLGRKIAAAALTGNRLVLDPSLDVNQAAAIVHDAKRGGRTAVWGLGNGSSLHFALQTVEHLKDLGVADCRHDCLLRFRGGKRTGVAATPPRAWLDELPGRPPKRLLDGLDEAVERLGEAHLRADLERKQSQLQQRMKETGAHLQAKVLETQTQFQMRVQETQSQIQQKMLETQAQIQAELNRIQSQTQQRILRLLGQVKKTDSEEE